MNSTELAIGTLYVLYALLQALWVTRKASTTFVYAYQKYDIPFGVLALWAPAVTLMVALHWCLKPFNGSGIYQPTAEKVIR